MSGDTDSADRHLRALRGDDDPGLPGRRSTATAPSTPTSAAPRATARGSSSTPPSSWSAATPTATSDIYERSGGTTTLVSQGQINGNGAFGAGFTGASSDGSRSSSTTDEQLVSGDTDSTCDLYERSGGTTTRVSEGQINGNGAFRRLLHGASSDGSKVFFSTNEQLVSGDTDSSNDIYERSGGTTTQVSQGQINGNGAFIPSSAAPRATARRSSSAPTSSWSAATPTPTHDVYERSGGTTKLVSVEVIPPQTTIDSGPSGTELPRPSTT